MPDSDADDAAVVDELRRAGLYDPDADGAAERLALLRFGMAHGVTVDELVEADRLGRLAYVAGDPHIRPAGERVTLEELAERAGTSIEEVERMWRAAGLTEPGLGENTLVEANVAIADVLPNMATVLDVLHRRHLLATNCRLMTDADTRESPTKHLAIGFADRC